ncbi:fumarylacetoacetate hydrolase family protein [Variovorax terrae]|uniref:Fumarylacetoacetate hydrolase family protein n=1 Tax=Variovorax terrae TaxID=2923278 RepID=A0A9X2AS27_9BURK|nr:fumarylacetoacetate hydrolase family protein [Variovorax terrae]MCJ0766132.1 fumarylacetoacetate hydrolase family protein [Variovorax terrae]
MSEYVVPPPPLTAVPIAGAKGLFPVRRVYCVGRNYADHAIEMGVDPRQEPPFFFCKPADTVVWAAAGPVDLPYPDATKNLHHEVELVVAIGKAGRNIEVDTAVSHIWGYAIGIDMTRRDLQQAMRQGGKPWEIGKTFERCAPIGPIFPISETRELTRGQIALSVNGQRRQASDLSMLIWSTREIIATLSRYFTLEPGDLIFTGTPEGVGPVQAGDALSATVEGLGTLDIRILPALKEVVE